jgi:hypothetical protein
MGRVSALPYQKGFIMKDLFVVFLFFFFGFFSLYGIYHFLKNTFRKAIKLYFKYRRYDSTTEKGV